MKGLDFQLLAGVGFIIAASLTSLFSMDQDLFYRQIAWLALGVAVGFLLMRFDWRPFLNYRGVPLGLYIATVFFLFLTLVFAPEVRGARAWLPILGFRFQPSEFMKIILILIYANFFRRAHVSIAYLPSIIRSFIYAALPVGLVILQPDMGSAVTILGIWFGFLLVSGLRLKHLFAAAFITALLGVFMWNFGLEHYQKERITGFLFAEYDPLGINYNVIQSKVAVGSAGLWGKGFGQGTQAQLGFLPEAKTDFIFAAFIEEWGILLGFLLIGVFLFVIFRVVSLGVATHNNFNRFLCLGAVIYWVSQFILNVGSNLGLTPVVGVTFPFLSYGGSSLLTNMALLGILQSVAMRRSFSS